MVPWGAGEVYRVQRQLGGESFAVKTLQSGILNSTSNRRLFIRELRTWIDLPEHKHITGFRFFRTVGDRLAIFSEYVNGGPLSDWIRDAKLTRISDILDVAIQVAWGLSGAHESGVIHQDIKPSNILLTEDRIAKITDYGLAKACHTAGIISDHLPGSAFVSASGMTPAYCSHEQGNRERLNHKSDIWSYGLTILEMFTGPATWEYGPAAGAVLEDYLKEMPRKPYPAMPETLIEILRNCFLKEESGRWESVALLADKLIALYETLTGESYYRGKPPALHQISSKRLNNHNGSWRHWRDPETVLDDVNVRVGIYLDSCNRGAGEPVSGSRKTRTLYDLELFEEAEALLEKYHEDLKGEGDRILARILVDRAKILEFISDDPGAINALDRAESLMETLQTTGDTDTDIFRARINLLRGTSYQNLRRYKPARESVKAAIGILDSNESGKRDLSYISLLCQSYTRLADIHRMSNRN